MTNSTWRRSASRLTSFITGKRPYAPVPITSRWHFHGIFSSTDKGVCPNSSRNLLEGAFLRLRISPQSITTSCSYVLPSIRRAPKENLSKCTPPCSVRAPLCSGALLRGDSREGRPPLFHLVTAAVRTGALFRVMLCHGQNLLECFLAGVAEELIVGHTDLPQSKNGCSWILDPRLEQVQSSPDALRKVNSTYTAGVWRRRLKKSLRSRFAS